MSAAPAVAIAATFVWLGMIAGISFIEAPLKFSAPNVTLQIGLSIGRLVFRALNAAEIALTVVIAVAFALGRPPCAAVAGFAVAVAMLVIQLVGVRPRLNRRSDQVLAGLIAPRSRGHYVYVGLEFIKVAGLITAGIVLLST